jgi:NadR type nicotinamide-nucleotide adenylyltransferase
VASFPRRIVLTGAESTGKTTLAEDIATRYRLPWVPEYARQYAETRGAALTIDDVEPIARGQLALERRPAADAPAVLDTNLLSTWIYGHYYYHYAPTWIDEYLRAEPADLYLLCEVDLPWVADSVRDRAARRDEIQHQFVTELATRRLRFAAVRGAGPARLQSAVAAIEQLTLE